MIRSDYCDVTKAVHREDDGTVRFDDLAEKSKANLMALGNGQLMLGCQLWQMEEDRRKGSNIVRTLILPNISCSSEQSRDIQEVLSLILRCKSMYCFGNFAESIYQIGNAHDMHSIIQGGLISGGKRSQEGQAVIVFHSREHDVPQSRSGSSNRGIQKYLESSPKYRYWCNLKLAQRKRLQFFQTRSHAIALLTTQLSICIEIGIHEDWMPLGYRASYLRQIRNVDVRIFLIPK